MSAESVNGAFTAKNYIGVQGVFARQTSDGTDYMLKNGHGDVAKLVRNGAVVQNYDFDAFGNHKTETTNDTNPFRYSGEYFDEESGLIYLRNRYYIPETQRFITEDPIQDGLNWYAYCYNNPVAFIDPSGMTGSRFVVTDGSNLNMRSSPGTDFEIIASLENGTEVTFTGNKTSVKLDGHYWAEVTYGDKTGWVAATYLAYERPGTRNPMVFVGTHGVYIDNSNKIATGGNHSNVIIFADPTSQMVKDNPNIFTNKISLDGEEWVYGTFGAAEKNGGPLGTLVAANNRYGDVSVVTGESPDSNMIWVSTEYTQVLGLIEANNNFLKNHNGTVKYMATSTLKSQYYNSNSYARGLLKAAGISAPNLKGWFPLWDKPIPTYMFR